MRKMQLMNKNSPVFWVLLLLPIYTGPLSVQEEMTLQECRERTMKQNKKIEIANENELAIISLEKSAKTFYYPNIKFNRGCFRMNKQLSLFSENMFLPVVLQEVFRNGLSVLDPSQNPDLVRKTIVTQDVNDIPVLVEDPK